MVVKPGLRRALARALNAGPEDAYVHLQVYKALLQENRADRVVENHINAQEGRRGKHATGVRR